MSVVAKPVIDILSRGDDNGLNDIACLFLFFLAQVSDERRKANHHPDNDGIARRDFACCRPHDGRNPRLDRGYVTTGT